MYVKAGCPTCFPFYEMKLIVICTSNAMNFSLPIPLKKRVLEDKVASNAVFFFF